MVDRSPNATHKTVGRPRYSQQQVRLANREILLLKSMSEFFLVIKYIVLVSIFLCRTAKNYCGPPWVPSGWSIGRTRIFRKDKFGTGTPHLADMPTAVHRQNSWKITGWSHGTVSMAMHCLGYNKLTPDGDLANHVFGAAVAVAIFDTGSEALFFSGFATPHQCAPLETIPVETLPMTNVITHKLLDSGQQHMWPHPQAITRRSNYV